MHLISESVLLIVSISFIFLISYLMRDKKSLNLFYFKLAIFILFALGLIICKVKFGYLLIMLSSAGYDLYANYKKLQMPD